MCGRSILEKLGKWLNHNLMCVDELSVFFFFCECDFSAFTDFLVALKDTNVSSLTIDFSFQRDGKGYYQAKFLHAIKSNFNLTLLQITDLDSGASPILSSETMCVGQGILRMNKAGRRYIPTDATNKQRGINVLYSVQSDLNCPLLHLLENPFLCSRRQARIENAPSCLGEAKTRKRKSHVE